MSGSIVNIKQCKKCKNYYDANIRLNMLRCPHCFQKQERTPRSNNAKRRSSLFSLRHH